MNPRSKLIIVKMVHTVVWAVFAMAIFLIPVFASAGHLKISISLICFVLIEVLILGFNKFNCPLTGVAGRYTTERQENFDIYLPLWLAKYNKWIFGSLFLAGCLYTGFVWWVSQAGP